MDVSRAVSEGYKVWLALAAMGLAGAWMWLPRRVAVGLLTTLTLVASLNYVRWGPKLPKRVDPYDLIHYYLNAKYFDELDYFDLYPACILADHENNGPYFTEGNKYLAQDENGHALKPIEHALARGRVVKETHFTPARWTAFTHDFLFLQRNTKGLDDELWPQLIQDHGFNGTTVWTMIARPITEIVPVEAVKYLCLIDIVLLAGALVGTAWAFGAPAALWGTLFLVLTYSARWPTYGSAFLRYDYVSALLLGMALLKKGRPFLAGLLTGYAATLRLFPAMWLYGPGAKGVGGLLGRKVHRNLLVLLAGFIASVGVLQGLAVVDVGADAVRLHLENMEDHNSSAQLSSRRIGFALALPFRGDLDPKNITKAMKATIEDQKPLRYALAAGMLLLLGWALRRADDDEAFALGFIPFFLLTTASYYYYVARLPLVAMHATRLGKPRHTAGLVWLLGLEAFSNWAETAHPEHRVYLIGCLSWGLVGYTVVMTVWMLFERRKAEKAADLLTSAQAA
jgi:hypothetical protein